MRATRLNIPLNINLLILHVPLFLFLFFSEKNHLKKLNSEIDNQKSRVDRYGRRVVRLEEFTKGQSTALVERTNELMAIRPSLKSVVQIRIDQLVKHIFTLSEVHPIIFQ